MKIKEEDLLPNESIVLKKNANAVIGVTESGLSQFAFDKLMWAIGMKGKEAIGEAIPYQLQADLQVACFQPAQGEIQYFLAKRAGFQRYILFGDAKGLNQNQVDQV